jgi:hypothetical protein
MEKDTLKLLGKVLRESLPLEDSRENKRLRRPIVQIQQREREHDRPAQR